MSQIGRQFLLWWDILKAAYVSLVRDDGLALAGNIAFCMILALFPFLIFLTALAGFFGNPDLAQQIVDYLLSVAPRELAEPVAPEIQYIFTVPRTDLLTLGIVLTLWTASAAVESVRVGLNRAYGFTETRPYWWRLILNVLFIIGGAVVLLVLSASLVIGPALWHKLEVYFPILSRYTDWFFFIRYPLSLSLMALALIICHKFLPVKRNPLRDLLPGIVVTMVLWLISAFAYAAYLSRFNTLTSMYEGLTGFMISLVFLYLSGALLIAGAEINQAIIAHRRAQAREGLRIA